MLKISNEDYSFLEKEYPEAIDSIKKGDLRETLIRLFEKIVYYTSNEEGLSEEGRKFDEIYTRLYNDND